MKYLFFIFVCYSAIAMELQKIENSSGNEINLIFAIKKIINKTNQHITLEISNQKEYKKSLLVPAEAIYSLDDLIICKNCTDKYFEIKSLDTFNNSEIQKSFMPNRNGHPGICLKYIYENVFSQGYGCPYWISSCGGTFIINVEITKSHYSSLPVLDIKILNFYENKPCISFLKKICSSKEIALYLHYLPLDLQNELSFYWSQQPCKFEIDNSYSIACYQYVKDSDE